MTEPLATFPARPSRTPPRAASRAPLGVVLSDGSVYNAP